MIPKQDFAPHEAFKGNPQMTRLAKSASKLGFEVVDVAGFLENIGRQSQQQSSILRDVRRATKRVLDSNTSVFNAVGTVADTTRKSLQAVGGSVNFVRSAGQQTKEMAEWMQGLENRAKSVSRTVDAVRRNNDQITKIAAQVNILAINAKIEAGRAGDMGRGFGVVAEAINELSHQAERAATEISGNILALTEWITDLQTESEAVSKTASTVLQQSDGTDRSLVEIQSHIQSTHDGTARIETEASVVQNALQELEPAIGKLVESVNQNSIDIVKSNSRLDSLVTMSEKMLQGTVALGGTTTDSKFISYVQDTAAQIGRVFEHAIERGDISTQDLFDQQYAPIAGTDPQQVITRFTQFTDTVLPQFQETALDLDPRVVFCAAVDQNGYLPTHNQKFSHPQRGDPIWNMANSRNRRLFDDRVGLKAGRNSEAFLLQVYRRDMGGGNFRMMKDLSAPILVNGRHWGGLRLAFGF